MAMSQYHPRGCPLYYRLISSAIGILIGLSAGACFAVVFHNYHCAGWGLVSSVFATVALVMHICVYRDLAYSIEPATFSRLKYVGIFGMLLGVSVFVGYFVKGMLVKETGIVVKGWFIVMVWGYMTWKWGFLLFWYARKYHNVLVHESTDLFAVNDNESYRST